MRETRASIQYMYSSLKKMIIFYTSACLSVLGENKQLSMKLSIAIFRLVLGWMNLYRVLYVDVSCISSFFYSYLLCFFLELEPYSSGQYEKLPVR